MSAETIAQAVWTYITRTQMYGNPPAPTTRAEQIAETVWNYGTRTLTTGGEQPHKEPPVVAVGMDGVAPRMGLGITARATVRGT